VLDAVERAGNRLPDPAILFVVALVATWLLSAWLDGLPFEVPAKTGAKLQKIQSQLTGRALTEFASDMLSTFTGFQPLGVVLVALLGVGIAEHSGFIDATLKGLLGFTPKRLLTPLVVLAGLLSHTAGDAGYVLAVPLGGVIFHAAGRHPLAGIAAAFAGVSCGFGANPVPSGLDPLLQGLTQEAVRIVDPSREVNPLCNWFFAGASCALVIALAWVITDKLVEPRLRSLAIDGDEAPKMDPLTDPERRGMLAGLAALVAGIVLLVVLAYPRTSPLRAPNGALSDFNAPLMKSIVPLVLLLFLLPGLVHGYVSGRFATHRDVVKGMSKTMSTMGYYIVMVFFLSLFVYAFNKSKLGALVAVTGGHLVRQLGMSGPLTIVGMILLCAFVNLLIGSASAKWALLAPIFVPMLMHLGLSPELTQAAYRIGDSTTDIITPLMPYFPLVVAFSQRYVRGTGIGTVTSLMLPYAVIVLVGWSALLLLFWALGIPLGIQGGYYYP